MDIDDHGKLVRLAATQGKVVGSSALVEDLERLALAIHVERKGAPALILAGSANHDVVLAMFADDESAPSCQVAARALVDTRADELGGGRVLSVPAGSARGLRGGTGKFATFAGRELGLAGWITCFAVHVPPPVCEWDVATLAEVNSAVPDLVSRFPKRARAGKGAGAVADKDKPGAAKKTIVRRRE